MQTRQEPSSSSSSDMLTRQQKTRADFMNRQQHRLHELIRAGILCVGRGALIWIDENGLLAAQNTHNTYEERLEDSAPLFHAGSLSDVDDISKSISWPGPSGAQGHLGKETHIWGSLLKKLAIKELRLLPAITHSVWKELLGDLERLATAQTSPSTLLKKLEVAIAQEQEDWEFFSDFINNKGYEVACDDMDKGDLPQTVYRIAGVNVDRSQSAAALREIDENLADKMMRFSFLADEVYDSVSNYWRGNRRKASAARISELTESANELIVILSHGKIGPFMEKLIESVEKVKEAPEED